MPVRNIKQEKTDLRAKYRSIREAMSPDRKLDLDSSIQCRLLAMREYAGTETLFTYVSKSIEVDTLALIKAAWLNRKKVAVPRCVPGTRDMEFYFVSSMEDMEPGMFGVLEPNADRCALVSKDEKGLCIVPGLSFDAEGYRLGYGKGYYDRFLSGFGGLTVGICYSQCVQWKLPHGYYDRPVDILITEKYIRKTSRG